MSPSRRQGGTGSARFERAPVPAWPLVHSISLPTPWATDSVQVYLIESDPLTLVDCGLDDEPTRVALESALDGLGYAVEDIRRVVVTHYHRDHLGQAQHLRERADALEVWAHIDSAPMIEAFSLERNANVAGAALLFHEYGVPETVVTEIGERHRRRLATEPALCRPTRVDRLLHDGDAIAFKDFTLEVIHSPGHTAGHILLHHEPSGVLLSGDQIMGGAVPNTENYFTDGLPDPADPLRRRPRFRGLLEYRRSLRGLRTRSFSTILPGYGGAIQHPERAIREALLFYEVRVQRIERSLKSVSALGQSVTAYEIWRALFPGEDPVTGMWNHLLTVIGALDVLEDEGRAVTERGPDGVLLHRHAG